MSFNASVNSPPQYSCVLGFFAHNNSANMRTPMTVSDPQYVATKNISSSYFVIAAASMHGHNVFSVDWLTGVVSGSPTEPMAARPGHFVAQPWKPRPHRRASSDSPSPPPVPMLAVRNEPIDMVSTVADVKSVLPVRPAAARISLFFEIMVVATSAGLLITPAASPLRRTTLNTSLPSTIMTTSLPFVLRDDAMASRTLRMSETEIRLSVAVNVTFTHERASPVGDSNV